jgi:hypothetical protein
MLQSSCLCIRSLEEIRKEQPSIVNNKDNNQQQNDFEKDISSFMVCQSKKMGDKRTTIHSEQ